jgi:ABC-2 type transport system permease protein
MANATPIADLSYRNYEGPLEAPEFRWWVIAKMSIRRAIKNRWYWLVMMPAAGYYLAMVLILFVVEQMASNSVPPNAGMKEFLARIVWKDQFLHGFSYGQMWYLVVALMLGAGTIANDNRANALLVYLSKPCTKLDYLIGKWVGIFLPLLAVMLLPALFFYGFGLMSYRDSGFFTSDKLLLPKILLLMPVGAAFEASLIVAVSSLFKQGQIAGATFAALYFITNFFTHLVAAAWSVNQFDEGPRNVGGSASFGQLIYASVDGIQIGWAKAVLGTAGSQPFGIIGGPQQHFVPAPNAWAVLLIMVVMSLLAMLIAWRRIHAVEVVG